MSQNTSNNGHFLFKEGVKKYFITHNTQYSPHIEQIFPP